MSLLRVAIVGARGYVGGELATLIASHPRLQLSAAFSRSQGGTPLGSAMPQLHAAIARGVPGATRAAELLFTEATPEAVVASKCDVVVLALPNGASAPYVEAVQRAPGSSNTVIVDVSADGRFEPARYAYGLPEIGANRARLRNAKLVANPGCYATSAQVALWPLVKAQLIGANSRPPAIFAISGYSGAGSTPSPKTDPVYLGDSVLAYSSIGHVHEREISSQMGVQVHFMPHVAPFFRGIQATTNVELDREVPLDAILAAYNEAYANEPLIRVQTEPPRARELANTHGAAVGGFTLKGRRLVVCSAIDNLAKGAASQALQNINITCGLDEMTGLEPLDKTPASVPGSTPPPPVAPKKTATGAAEDPNNFFVNNYARPSDVVLTRGEGVYAFDELGRKYLDFTSGIAVNAFGHADRRWATVIGEQAARLGHTSNLMHNRPAVDLAHQLTDLAKPWASHVFLSNSGTEANEAALKFARLARPRGRYVAFKGSFHGRSMGSLSVTYKPTIRLPFEPLLECAFLEYNTASEELLRFAIDEKVAGVIIEPIQGEGGVRKGDVEFLKRVRRVCDDVGAALIYDEVQCGLGRSGSVFGFQQLGAPAPDMLTLAKPIAGGLPAGAVLVGDRIAKHITPGAHGSTFAGNAIVMAAALDTVRRVTQPDLLRSVTAKGERLVAVFQEVLGEHCVGARGVGLLRGFELRPPLVASALVAACRRHNFLIAGTDNPQVIRVLPPLNIEDKDVAAAAEALKAALPEALAESKNAATKK
jgi:N-acetyl-gamma-glutamyl-phosphate reductase common form